MVYYYSYVKLTILFILLNSIICPQAFYPESQPLANDQVFTSSQKLRNFLVKASYFTNSLSNPNKYIAKQAIILTPFNNVIYYN